MKEILQINLFCMKVSRFNFSLATVNELQKVKNKHLFKLCICGEDQNIRLWANYFKQNKPSIKVDTNTWKNDNNRSGIIEPWTSESFLAHLTGTSPEERIELVLNN
jgi:hypothetical protein